MRQLTTETEFVEAETRRGHVLIRDVATGSTRHRLPCRNVKLRYFHEKVVKNGGRNGSYWLIEDDSQDGSVGSAKACSACNPPGPPVSGSAVRSPDLAVHPDLGRETVMAERGGPGATLRWVGNSKGAFEAWCSRQIDLESRPPDPRGSVRKLIQEGLPDLRPTSGSLLRATFNAVALVPMSDVENVLFTNVDPTGSAFRGLVLEGLEFEFKAGDRSGVAPQDGLACCSTYDWIPRLESDSMWASFPALAKWSKVPVPDLGRISRAPALWWHLRRAHFDLDMSAARPRLFGVDLRVEVPPGLAFNAAAKVKPAIDAVVLCLSADDGRSTNEGIVAMAQYAGGPEKEVRALLFDDSTALLGKHRLVDRRGQVCPPDHGCVRGRMVVESSADDQWRLSARVVELG